MSASTRSVIPRELTTPRDICDVFVKIGGSILDDAIHTAQLVPSLIALSKEQRLVALPGGGQVAKRIVANQRNNGSDFQRSWRSGITSLDVHAGLLASYSPSFAVAASVLEITTSLAQGKMAVLAPAAKIVSDLELFPDFDVTTDSMGLYFAAVLGARRYVIVSNVDGIYPRAPDRDAVSRPIACLTPQELEDLPSSKLDRAFPHYFRRYPLPVMIVNGRSPERVSAAIRGRPTLGTEIVLSYQEPRSV